MSYYICEVYNPATGEVDGYRPTRERAEQTVERLERAGHAIDYMPAKPGYYIIKDAFSVTAGPFEFWHEANQAAQIAALGVAGKFDIVRHEP